MATSVKEKCTHSFKATSRKGVLEVESFSLNKRGKPQNKEVVTTVFECDMCGEHKEYPDSWEKNFRLLPVKAAAAVAAKAVKKAAPVAARTAKKSVTVAARAVKKAAPVAARTAKKKKSSA